MIGHRTRLAAVVTVLGLLFGVVGWPTAAVADSIRDGQWYLRFLDVAKAHQISQGAGVVVGLVDSGADGTHPDLAGNVAQGTEVFLGSKGGNGWTDEDGHGTAMAGLIAAHGHGPGNADGVLGIAPKATILPVRAGITGTYPAIEAGIRWATDHGARVISLSVGSADPSPDEERAVANAIQHDVVLVAGVGNLPRDKQIIYPAAYPGVLAVGGMDQSGNHASLSVTGPAVALSAPAINMTLTNPGGKYRVRATGTSEATAIVAGAAALVRAKFPNLSATEVIHRLTATAIDKGPQGRDDQYGYGIVNLVGALTADVPPLQPSTSPTPDAAAPNNSGTSPLIWLFIGLGLATAVVITIAVIIAVRLRPTRS